VTVATRTLELPMRIALAEGLAKVLEASLESLERIASLLVMP